ncbi:protein lev-9-like isoform X2 [Physella acuta]|uniref:protein lev-9-like isoform X1 n=1 Tax=Physella acuta TaxID=109671 RepID=UPI0027DBFCBA|nr:protein lev-9-like isoform X1 [Physella acuta]XP_059177918.1 protein lev-9-like isoform X2 [Physella acuta]
MSCEQERRTDDPESKRCSKRCTSDLDCLNDRKKCMCDGRCGKSCINPNLRCYPTPQDIPNGRVEIKPYNRFEAFAAYTCNEGYTLVGLPARVCQGDETWIGDEPKCVPNYGQTDWFKDCLPPPPVQHATHDGAPGQYRFPQGTNLQYTCGPGFTAQKDSVERAWCVPGGVWVGPNLTCSTSGCPDPPNIPNGYVRVSAQSGLDSRVTYTCKTGYVPVGSEVRTCLKDGTWDGVEPQCVQVACGPPPFIENADHDLPKDQMKFMTGTQLTYHCRFGFYREGSNMAICSGAEGKWIGPNMSCKARDCGDPGEIAHGWRDPGYRFVYPTRVTYHCSEGYELRGRPYRECKANGEWSDGRPECEPINCNEVQAPIHGYLYGSSTTYGSIIKVTCKSGFKVVGSAERSCQSDRTWSGLEATCEEINCGNPGPLHNGYLDGHSTTVGNILHFRCRERTRFNGTSFSTRCLENGQWSDPLPRCLGQCPLPSIESGSIPNVKEGMYVDHGLAVHPKCHNGLVLNDLQPVTCDNGTWTHIPKCVPAPCRDPPPPIENGHRTFFQQSHGTRVRYFCMAGYKLADGHRFMVCEFGQWKGQLPVCVENLCENPGQLVNGNIYKVGKHGKFQFREYIFTIRHGDRLVYECSRNYKLIGPRGAACVNGKWSPQEKPVCEKSSHPLFTKLWKPYEENGSSRGNLFY